MLLSIVQLHLYTKLSLNKGFACLVDLFKSLFIREMSMCNFVWPKVSLITLAFKWRAPTNLFLFGISGGGSGIVIIIVLAALFMDRGDELMQNRVLCHVWVSIVIFITLTTSKITITCTIIQNINFINSMRI